MIFKSSSILNKLKRAFILQGMLIALAVLLSLFFAKLVINEILVKNALIQEAEYYWEHSANNPYHALPNTKNLHGYTNKNQLESNYAINASLPPGFHDHISENNKYALHISSKNSKLLYLIYDRSEVDSLAIYYGLFPLSLILFFIYTGLLFTYRFSRKTFSPVSLLAKQLNEIDFSKLQLDKFKLDNTSQKIDHEIDVLYNAVQNLGERLQVLIERERNFTRDASHEMRTPLTVINIAADMLISEQELSEPAKMSIARIKNATSDMLELTNAFLLLARESDNLLSNNLLNINDVLAEEIEQINIIKDKITVDIRLVENATIQINASDKAVSVLFGNLLRNAIDYTEEGIIEIIINEDSVTISDSGKGMEDSQIKNIFTPYYRGSESTNPTGHGVGMTIVKRFSDRFNWPISIKSEVGKGTSISVSFKQ